MKLAIADAREAARGWIAATITKHLHPELGGADRIRRVADQIEETAYERNMPVEMAVELTAEWCDEQNDAALTLSK